MFLFFIGFHLFQFNFKYRQMLRSFFLSNLKKTLGTWIFLL